MILKFITDRHLTLLIGPEEFGRLSVGGFVMHREPKLDLVAEFDMKNGEESLMGGDVTRFSLDAKCLDKLAAGELLTDSAHSKRVTVSIGYVHDPHAFDAAFDEILRTTAHSLGMGGMIAAAVKSLAENRLKA